MKKLIVQVQFVVDAGDDCETPEAQWEAVIGYCSAMFHAVNYPNRIGDEWYVESIYENNEEPEDLGFVLNLYNPETGELVYPNDGGE